MKDRATTKQEELIFLAEEYKKHPELFAQRTFIEDQKTLGEFGIYIPGKENFLTGTLKLWPEDFIVEEVDEQGNIVTVQKEFAPIDTSEEGSTTYATLVKCGITTFEAIEDIAHALNIGKEQISYAGIKDKDAITAQRITVRNIDPSALANISSPHFFIKDVRTGKGIVEKGRLRGNRFTILIRTEHSLLEKPYSQIVAGALEKVHRAGFYNFYYLQRFGTPRLENYKWAYKILRGNYEEAVREVLASPTPRELEYFVQIRKTMGEKFGQWQEIKDIIAPYPLIFAHEHKIVNYLIEHPGDFAGALKTIPEQITLWMYALNSLFFNQKISEYVIRGEEPPAELPNFLSTDRNDQKFYESMLKERELYPVPLQNLRPFPNVQVRKRSTPAKENATILKGEVTEDGLVLQFELGKGQYATTFLSHLFNIVSGHPLEKISKKRVDTGAVLGIESTAPTTEYFKSVIQPKGENMFDTLLKPE